MLLELGFIVTLNPDNRLMSRTTLSREYALVGEAFGLSLAQLRPIAIAAADAMFLDHPERLELVNQVDRAWSAAVAFPS